MLCCCLFFANLPLSTVSRKTLPTIETTLTSDPPEINTNLQRNIQGQIRMITEYSEHNGKRDYAEVLEKRIVNRHPTTAT
jgi:hypothetical protein